MNLEIGDTAGEHWIALDERSAEGAESDYLAWVMSAQALVHVVSFTDLTDASTSERKLSQDADDLRLVSRLMRAKGGGNNRRVGLLVVLSKADLLSSLDGWNEEMRSAIFEEILLIPWKPDDFFSLPIVHEIEQLGVRFGVLRQLIEEVAS